MERMTIAQAAKQLGLTQEAIRQRIRRGTIDSHKGEDGRTYVYLDDSAPVETNGAGSRELVEALRSQITSLEADKDVLREEAHRMQQIIMALSQKIPDPKREPEPLKELTGDVKDRALRGLSRWARVLSRR